MNDKFDGYRARFTTSSEDYRPLKWPVSPYWVSGYDANDHAVIVAYVATKEKLLELWPEAENIDLEKVDRIIYSSRFPRPAPDFYEADNSSCKES